jgi:hypothetical protein
MTECTTDGVEFSRHGRRAVRAAFDGGTITSDAGGLLLREADRTLRLTERLAAALTDPREPSMIVHEQGTMLRQRIFATALGYADLNDHDTLRDDAVLRLMADADALASAPTLCRLENRVDRRSMWRMAAVLVDAFVAAHKTAPAELVLDFDATDDAVHGKQERRAFHAYYDSYCFLPLYVFCGEQLLAAYLRPSNIDAARHAWAILALLVKRLRAAWPGVRIVVRADSGFCRWRMLRWCDRHGVDYIVGVSRNSRLEEMAAPLAQQARDAFAREQTKQRVFGEIRYAASTWDTPRRVIVKAEHLPSPRGADDKSNLRFVVTSLQGDGKDLYERVYCARGEMENRIKEQQMGLFADRTSCHRFAANQFRLLLSAAAYVLVEHIRRVALHGTELARAQVARLRLELFKIGARVVLSARRIVLHLAKGFPHAAVLSLAAQRLMAPT